MPTPPGASEPKLIFKTADVFSEAAVTLLHKAWNEEKPYLSFAFGVNAALATELYLKCLLLIECGQIPKIHNLKSLFGQLPRKTRQVIRKQHDKAVHEDRALVPFAKQGIKFDLDTLLQRGQDVFELFRYPYEPRAKDTFFGLSGLANCVRQHILSLHPEWIDNESTSLDH
jgi:hypothetical protein